MRRVPIAVLLSAPVLALPALAGCGEEAGSEAPRALERWTVSAEAFVPRVRAPEPARELRRAQRAAAAADEPQPPAPAAAADEGPDVSEGAPSDAEIAADLERLYGKGAGRSAGDGGFARTVSLSGGRAEAPPDAPAEIQAIVSAANRVAKLPYVYGGGHGTDKGEGIWVDNAYDCSGSMSFAFASAGLLKRPLDSTSFMRWGRPGRGKWVTVYANAGHAFMVIGGARFDTSGLRQSGSRWQPAQRSVSGFTARHPPGL